MRAGDARRVSPVVVAYAAFVFVGLYAGAGGVLLPAQMRDYDTDQAVIGVTFFASAAGFVVASATVGLLLVRYGARGVLVGATALFGVAGAVTATRPQFLVFVLIQVLIGYSIGMLESVLNAHLAARPDATILINLLHAFFGVGALLGPLAAAWVLTVGSWTTVWAALASLCVPLATAMWFAFQPRRFDIHVAPAASSPAASSPAASSPAVSSPPGATSNGLLPATLRQPAVLLGALLLAVYVGLELGVGRWGFSYLLDARDVPALLAGYTISGYWLGLTLGRFSISPIATALGATQTGLVYGCLLGVGAAGLIVWTAPTVAVVAGGFVLMGFFLGPIFPTTIAIVPQVTQRRLVPTAIGVLNAGSVIGGSALPWLAGAAAQFVGAWTLAPFAIVLALLQVFVWR